MSDENINEIENMNENTEEDIKPENKSETSSDPKETVETNAEETTDPFYEDNVKTDPFENALRITKEDSEKNNTEAQVSAPLSNQNNPVNLEFLMDVKLHVSFEVGRSKMLISDLLSIGQGSVIELDRLVGENLYLFVNGQLLATGEVVVINERFGCQIADIISPEERIKKMGHSS